MLRILVTDPLHPAGLELLEQSSHEIHVLPPEDKPRLGELIGDFDAVVIRSGTRLDEDLLALATDLSRPVDAGFQFCAPPQHPGSHSSD